MAYVGDPFAYDLFVSYSHGDPDGSGHSKLRQWSQGFARELESEMRAHPHLGRELRIFLDQHHRPSDSIDPLEPLSAQLRSDIEGSAILIVLMSPHYLASAWCRDEREWWHKKQSEIGLPPEGRIAVARIWPATDPWPAELTDARGEPLVGFCFYDKEQAELLPQPFDWPEPGPSTKDPFRRELLQLVGRIRLKLQEVRTRLDEERRAQEHARRLAAAGGQLVYLHARAEHAREWEAAANALIGNGLAVMPGAPDEVVSDPRRLLEIRHSRVEIMSGCDALLLVATEDARAIDQDLVVVGRQDCNSARALSNRLLPCALLDPVGAAIATPTRIGTARNLNVKWIDATQPAWPPAVQEWLVDVARDEARR